MQSDEIRKYMTVFARWWWVLMLGAALPVAASYAIAAQRPPLYRSSATLMVGGALQLSNPDASMINTAAMLAQTYAGMVQRAPITEAVIQSLALDISSEALSRQITARVQPQLQVLEIEVVGPEPEWSAAVANALAEELIARSPGTRQDGEDSAFNERQIADLRLKIDTLNTEITNEREALAAYTSAAEIRDGRDRLSAMEALLDSYRSTYAILVQAQLGDMSTNRLTLLERAYPPSVPTSQNLVLIMGISGLAGLALSIGAIVLFESVDDRVRWEGPGQIHVLGLPVLGAVASLSHPGRALVVIDEPSSAEAESVRALRTSILLSCGPHRPQVLLFTSGAPRVGKSVVTANIAAAIAGLGQATLLIDADLRKRNLHRGLGIKDGPGLTELLSQPSADPMALVQAARVAGLHVIRAGGTVVDPTRLLSSTRLATVLEQLKKAYDLIVIDSPAALSVPDAMILAAHSDAIVMLIDEALTTRQDLVRTKEALERQAKERVLGVAFNKVATRRYGAYGYYYQHIGRS